MLGAYTRELVKESLKFKNPPQNIYIFDDFHAYYDRACIYYFVVKCP